MIDNQKQRILIVEVNWLGDVLFSTAAIRALRKKNQNAFIACLVHERCREVLDGNPYIDLIINLDEEGWNRGFFGKLKLINQLKKLNFDTAYLFHRSFTRTLICYLSGIKNLIGYYTKKRGFLLTDKVIACDGLQHRSSYFHYLVNRKARLNEKSDLVCDFFVSDLHLDLVKKLLIHSGVDLNRPSVTLHAAGNWSPKRWPKENFAKLADALFEKFGVNIVFSGAKKEKKLVKEIIDMMKNKALDLSGMINLKELGALFLKSTIVISADSGPLHIAVALKRPVVALYGPTSPEVTGPLANYDVVVVQKDVGCKIPCYKVDCPDNRCMKEITPQEILQSIEEKKWLRIQT